MDHSSFTSCDNGNLDYLTLKMVVRFSETSVTIRPMTQLLIPEDLNLQQYRCENLKSRFYDNV
jgi:hypothetical protein